MISNLRHTTFFPSSDIGIRALNILLVLVSIVLSSCSAETQPESFTTTPYTIDVKGILPPAQIPRDNALTVEGVELGRHLFYERAMSKNFQQSCADCHHQEASFVDTKLKFSRGVDGLQGKRNAMAVVNLIWGKGFFWDGRSATLRDQALKPIQDHLEMNETLPNVVRNLGKISKYSQLFEKAFGTSVITPDRIALALEQFMMSIVSVDNTFDKVRRGEAALTPLEEEGRRLFFTENQPTLGIRGAECFHCHGSALFTNNEFMNNGLSLDSEQTDLGLGGITGKPSDKGKFKVPTLRNIAVTQPYMHDGRFVTLMDVINFYDTGVKSSSTIDPSMHTFEGKLNLTDYEKSALHAFLLTLTDQTFLSNPRFAKP